ncbi:MAG: hypothetical protein AAGF77_07020 [Bacteroidota bacterium]
MTRIKLTVLALILLIISSCKQGTHNKTASSATIESPILSDKVANKGEDVARPIVMAKDCNETNAVLNNFRN